MENTKLEIELVSFLTTLQDDARLNTRIIEKARQQFLMGNDVSFFFMQTETSSKKLQSRFEELKKQCGGVIDKVKDCRDKTIACFERNKREMKTLDKVNRIFLINDIRLKFIIRAPRGILLTLSRGKFILLLNYPLGVQYNNSECLPAQFFL